MSSNNKTICPNCGRQAYILWVHGHYQCSECKMVVISCCDGAEDCKEIPTTNNKK